MLQAPDDNENEVVALTAMSPVKRPRDVLRVTYKDWLTSPGWIEFRKGGTHLVQKITAMIDSGHLTESRRKRKRKNKSRKGRGEDSGSLEDKEIQRPTKVVDRCKWCVHCTKIDVRGGVGKGRTRPQCKNTKVSLHQSKKD
jgi:hypothetical protein